MLRARIQAAIELSRGDAEKAAIQVCVTLEELIGGFVSEGWFDDDDDVLEAIDKYYSKHANR